MVKLTRKQQHFLDIYAKYGGNRSLIMRELNIKHQQFEKYMRMPEVKEYIDCSMERVRNSMVAALPHISKTLLEMYNNANTDDKIKLEIAKQFLDRAGLFADKNVNVNVNINTSLSMRARQILAERHVETVETTASPVAERVSDVLPQSSTIETQQMTHTADPVSKQEVT